MHGYERIEGNVVLLDGRGNEVPEPTSEDDDDDAAGEHGNDDDARNCCNQWQRVL